MREIKFRAWYKNEKAMDNNPALSYYSRDKLWEASGWTVPEDAILMQFTGLRDRNGVDIYEGDIIQRFSDFGSPMGRRVVEWRESRACIGWNIGLGHYQQNRRLWRVEVIGNIYENPELLKEGA